MGGLVSSRVTAVARAYARAASIHTAMADDEEEVIPKKPILVLGAGGFVGSAIAKAFVTAEDEEGWEVTGTLRAGTAKPKWITHVIEVRAVPHARRGSRVAHVRAPEPR